MFSAHTRVLLTSLTNFRRKKMRRDRGERCFSLKHFTPTCHNSKENIF